MSLATSAPTPSTCRPTSVGTRSSASARSRTRASRRGSHFEAHPGVDRRAARGVVPGPTASTTRCSRPTTGAGWRRPAGPGADARPPDVAARIGRRPGPRARRPGRRRRAVTRRDGGGASEARRRLDGVGRRRQRVRRRPTTTWPPTPTSRLSPYLHFGCVSPFEVVQAVDGLAGAEPFVRQLCWRDFYQQSSRRVPTPRGPTTGRVATTGTDDPDALDAWKEGRTGYPVVDAGMRQLARRGLHAQPGAA